MATQWCHDSLVTLEKYLRPQEEQGKETLSGGDIMSPVIFNIMVDAVLCSYKQQLLGNRQGKLEYTVFLC